MWIEVILNTKQKCQDEQGNNRKQLSILVSSFIVVENAGIVSSQNSASMISCVYQK